MVNQLRGFLAEFGVVAPKGVNAFKAQWPRIRQPHAAAHGLTTARCAASGDSGLRPTNQSLCTHRPTARAADRNSRYGRDYRLGAGSGHRQRP